MIRHLLTAFSVLTLFMITACSEQETLAESQQSASKEVRVVVPESVVGKWKSVKIALYDQQAGTKNLYQIDIGGSFQIPDTSLRVTVEAFMPAFSVNSERATSASNQPSNPAVQIVVRDGEKEIHRGWVFGLYPERHQFEPQRYKLVLLDYRPAG